MTTPTKELVPVEGVNTDDMAVANELQVWTGYETNLSKLQTSAEMVLAADPSLPTTSKLARETRLDFKRLRVEVEHTRKERTEYHLRQKQKVDGQAKALREAMEHFEEKLLALEQHAERKEAERLKRLSLERIGELAKWGFTSLPSTALETMKEEDYAELLNGAKLSHEARIAEEKQREEARIAKEKAEAEERERIRLENIRLKEEAEKKEKELAAERERVAKEAAEAAEKARKEREAIELKAKQEAEAAAAKAKAEKEALEAKAREEKRLADEKAAKIKAEADKAAAEARRMVDEAKAQQEKASREAAAWRIEQEEKIAKRKAEAEAELAATKKTEADRLAAIEAEKAKAAAAPDKEKILAFGAKIRAMQMSALSTPKGKLVEADIAAKVGSFANWIEAKVKEVE